VAPRGSLEGSESRGHLDERWPMTRSHCENWLTECGIGEGLECFCNCDICFETDQAAARAEAAEREKEDT
jgi:hypothetical protein